MEKDENLADYQKGFNEGYTIAKYLPELAEQLSRTGGEGTRLSGLQEGRKQFLAEQLKERLPSWLKTDRFSQNDALKDKNKNIEKDIEPEL